MSKLKDFDYSVENFSYFITMNFKYKLNDRIISSLYESLLNIFIETDFLCEAIIVMPDHLHLVTKKEVESYFTLSDLICKLKSKSVYLLKQKKLIPESFWNKKYFDHVIRNEKDWLEKIRYIINNPIKAKIVNSGDRYPYLYYNFEEPGDTRPPSTRDDEALGDTRLFSMRSGKRVVIS